MTVSINSHILKCIYRKQKKKKLGKMPYTRSQSFVIYRIQYAHSDMKIIYLVYSNENCDRPRFSDLNKIQLEKVTSKKSFCKKKWLGSSGNWTRVTRTRSEYHTTRPTSRQFFFDSRYVLCCAWQPYLKFITRIV